MRADVTPGQTSDHKGCDLVMGDDLPASGALLADKGYDADRIRAWAEARDAIPVIPMHRNRKARMGADKTLYALRNLVERCFGRLKNIRRVATRHDK
jgi:transposase